MNHWKFIAEKMQENDNTSSWFYLYGRAIADGKWDLMPDVSVLMPESL